MLRNAGTPRTTADPPAAPLPLEGEAFIADLFERYGGYVAQVVFRVLGPDADLDDLVQDVFFVVVARRRELDRVQSIRHWLAGIAVKLARDVLRRRRVRRAFFLDRLAAKRPPRPDNDVFVRLHLALDGVSANERIAWVLRYLEGESLADVARICGCSLATAKRRIKTVNDQVSGVINDE